MSASKSCIWFSPRILRRLKDQVVGIFGIPTTDRIGIYLGTPIFTTRRTTNSYQFLVDKIQKRIEGWQAKYLSMAGWATLIKATVASIPIYAMQTTLLPQKISRQIDKMSCNFLWGDTATRCGCHTVNWDTVTLPKEANGLGIPSTCHRNRAILMNQAWRLYTNPDMLWSKVLKTKYFPQTTLFLNIRRTGGSHIWHSLSLGIKLLLDGLRWIVGDGQTIRIWKDQWLPQGTLRSYIEGPIHFQDEDQRVNSLQNHQTWNFNVLPFPIPSPLQNLIQGIPIAYFTNLPDTLAWPHNNGKCSVKSASQYLFHKQKVPLNAQDWKWIWALTCPKKIQMFLWKAMRDRLPTRTFLTLGRSHLNEQCPRCHHPETTIHILRDCPWAKEVWSQSLGILPVSFFQLYLREWLQSSATADITILNLQLTWSIYFPFHCWNLWLAKNERIFRQQSRS